MSRKARERLKSALIMLTERRSDIPSRFFWREVFLVKNLHFIPGYIVRHSNRKTRRRKKKTPLKDFNFHSLSNHNADSAYGRLKDYILILKVVDKDISAHDILKCRNVDVRRHLINEYGDKKFFAEVGAKVIHRDGSSRLMRVETELMPAMVMVEVKDSSTGERYLLRVPPTIRKCKEAIAWTFNMDDSDYAPKKET